MRPDSGPHLYDLSMAPNLLPFSASIISGGGSTPSTTATSQDQSGFAAMLGLGATPVTQAGVGSPISASVTPISSAPLVALADGATFQPTETAPPAIANVVDPEAVPQAPVATPLSQPHVGPVAPPPATSKQTVETPPLAPVDTDLTIDAPIVPIPAPAEPVAHDGTATPPSVSETDRAPVTADDESDMVAETEAEAGPAPVTIPEPVRTREPDPIPVAIGEPKPQGENSEAQTIATTEAPAAVVETAPVSTETVDDMPTAARDDAAPAPQLPLVAVPATSPVVPAPPIADPLPLTPDAEPAVAVAPRAAEPGPAPALPAAEVGPDMPVDDGRFDALVTGEPVADTGTPPATDDRTGDAPGREGHRQPAPPPSDVAPPSPTATPAPAFDPLAASDAGRTARDSNAAEPRARADAIGEDVGLAIVRHADTGSGDVLVIRLDPAELGKIEVRLRMDEARQLTAEVTADQPATLDLLRRDSDNLTRALNDAGFRADDQSLRFDSRGFGQNEQQAQQGRRIASRAYLPEDDSIASSIPSPVQVRSSGRVDLVA